MTIDPVLIGMADFDGKPGLIKIGAKEYDSVQFNPLVSDINGYAMSYNEFSITTASDVGWIFRTQKAKAILVTDNIQKFVDGGFNAPYFMVQLSTRFADGIITNDYMVMAPVGVFFAIGVMSIRGTSNTVSWQINSDKFGLSLSIIDGALNNLYANSLRPPTTAQPGQIVSVKSVDTSGKITETEAIPHPVLYVTISKTGNTNTSDKTFAEIKSAYDSGCSVFAVVDSFILPLLAVSDNTACFCATTPDGELHRVSVLITESSVSLAYGSFVEGNQGVENAGKILGIGDDGNVVPEDKPVQALAGSTAPTAATAGVIGQEYYVIVDDAMTEMYVCTAVANGTYTWDKVEFGGGSYTAGNGIKIENGEISLNLEAWNGGAY